MTLFYQRTYYDDRSFDNRITTFLAFVHAYFSVQNLFLPLVSIIDGGRFIALPIDTLVLIGKSHRLQKQHMHKQHFPTSYDDASNLMYTQERIIIRQKCFRVIAYRLINGEIAVPTRKMTAQVHKCELEGEQFIKSLGLEPSRVVLPNHVVTDMISISHAFDFWKYLNESGKGNPWTKLGQQFLEQYFSKGVREARSERRYL